jgi:ubiquinone biosynthesis accessory factor UbiJ
MTSMLVSMVYAPLEKILNALLEQDPAATNRLTQLCAGYPEDKPPVVSLTCTSPMQWQLFLLPRDGRLSLRAVCEEEATASISASASSFMRVVTAENPRTALFNPDITLNGDTHLVQTLFEIIRNLDFDWEHHLSSIVGDVATEQISRFFHAAREFSAEASTSMRSNLQEYLHEEARVVPPKDEVNEFLSGVDDLRLHIDRLEARVRKLVDGYTRSGAAPDRADGADKPQL